MSQSILEIKNLYVTYKGEENFRALNNISFILRQGETLGIVGESGSGKTTLALTLMGLLDKKAHIAGEVWYKDQCLSDLPEKEREQYRWNKISIVFQNSLEVLNPVLTIYEQIYECLQRHTSFSKEQMDTKVYELLQRVGLKRQWVKAYPHELSGGMRQRVLIAMALSCEPDVLIVDEPTTALDAMGKREIMDMLLNLQQEQGFSMIVISHEMQVIAQLTQRVGVLYSGYLLEEGPTSSVLKEPMHTYTRGLLSSAPILNPYRDLWGIAGEMHRENRQGCPFYSRCNQSIALCKEETPRFQIISAHRKVACHRGGIVTLLKAKNVKKQYVTENRKIQACKNCRLEIKAGETVVLLGQSGSGKTTLASILGGLLVPDEGDIYFQGEKVNGNNMTSKVGGVQMVFQDPFSAINEHFTILEAVEEPLHIMKEGTKEERKRKAIQALCDVSLPTTPGFLTIRCYQLSGGQRQRVAIARSLVTHPKVLLADEISSMLDPSTQANLLRFLKGLQNEKGFSMLYITHDIAVAQKIADRIYIMYQGEIVEEGNAWDLFSNPKHNYTKKLLGEGLARW